MLNPAEPPPTTTTLWPRVVESTGATVAKLRVRDVISELSMDRQAERAARTVRAKSMMNSSAWKAVVGNHSPG